ncbi:cytochrome P450 hydroxylase [Microbispora rosea subsp. aerata]|nr:cytochrome P450 [Microbispora rosea]GGO22254.1 cytochrome P450 hydroxylase [Microbispora rosea subsp. aerata]GIH57483.1 cytochrome P450 hydroxylase [Microbispora rosea subsp. aerata]GLJ86433.1 cytochrome P450 hydroxylase [Microbispora rosea subsp. aerata]
MTTGTPTPFDSGFPADPYSRLAPFRESCPVARVTTPAGRQVWLITRDKDVRAAFLNPLLSMRGGRTDPYPPTRRALDVTLVGHDPPHHTRLRRLVSPWLTPGRVEAYRPVAEAAAAELLDVVVRDDPADLMPFAHAFSFRVMCKLLGVPAADEPELYACAASVFARPVRDRAKVQANLDRIDAYFHEQVARRRPGPRRPDPGDDVVTAIVAAWDPSGPVSRDEVVSLCATLLFAGYESTAQMIGMSMAALLTRPDTLAALRAEPGALPHAVEELLRFHTPGPFGTMRTASQDVLVAGTVIPAGSRVLLSIAGANRDPARHADPDVLDIGRATAARHLTFGLGTHFCLGASLARLEVTVALRAILDRFPRMALAVAPERLTWQGNYLNRGLAELPVRLRG